MTRIVVYSYNVYVHITVQRMCSSFVFAYPTLYVNSFFALTQVFSKYISMLMQCTSVFRNVRSIHTPRMYFRRELYTHKCNLCTRVCEYINKRAHERDYRDGRR